MRQQPPPQRPIAPPADKEHVAATAHADSTPPHAVRRAGQPPVLAARLARRVGAVSRAACVRQAQLLVHQRPAGGGMSAFACLRDGACTWAARRRIHTCTPAIMHLLVCVASDCDTAQHACSHPDSAGHVPAARAHGMHTGASHAPDTPAEHVRAAWRRRRSCSGRVAALLVWPSAGHSTISRGIKI